MQSAVKIKKNKKKNIQAKQITVYLIEINIPVMNQQGKNINTLTDGVFYCDLLCDATGKNNKLDVTRTISGTDFDPVEN